MWLPWLHETAAAHYTHVIEDTDSELLYLAHFNRAWNRMLIGDQSGALADAQVFFMRN